LAAFHHEEIALSCWKVVWEGFSMAIAREKHSDVQLCKIFLFYVWLLVRFLCPWVGQKSLRQRYPRC
jgi:hypothetical protein